MTQPVVAIPYTPIQSKDTLQAVVAKPRVGPPKGRATERRQLLQMQQALYELTLSPKVPPGIRAQCARAFCDLGERKRVIDGIPLPGQLRPDLPDFMRASKRGKTLSLSAISMLDARLRPVLELGNSSQPAAEGAAPSNLKPRAAEASDQPGKSQ